MKKTAAAISIAALAVCLTAAATAPAAGKPDRTVVRTVVLQSTSGFSTSGGPNGGTLFGGTGKLMQGGVSVGSFSSACISTSPLGGQCSVTLIWNGKGRVQVDGSIRIDRVTNVASIVGGTGKFRGARGTMFIRRVSEDGSRQRARLRLIE